MKIVSTSSLNNQGENFKNYNLNILNDINNLSNVTDSILSCWDGDDAKSIVKTINDDIIPALNKYYDCLEDYAEYLTKVDQVFSTLDDAYNEKIDV